MAVSSARDPRSSGGRGRSQVPAAGAVVVVYTWQKSGDGWTGPFTGACCRCCCCCGLAGISPTRPLRARPATANAPGVSVLLMSLLSRRAAFRVCCCCGTACCTGDQPFVVAAWRGVVVVFTDTDEGRWSAGLASALGWKRLQRLRLRAAGVPLPDFWMHDDSLNELCGAEIFAEIFAEVPRTLWMPRPPTCHHHHHPCPRVRRAAAARTPFLTRQVGCCCFTRHRLTTCHTQ